jgi:hypothetical protein
MKVKTMVGTALAATVGVGLIAGSAMGANDGLKWLVRQDPGASPATIITVPSKVIGDSALAGVVMGTGAAMVGWSLKALKRKENE